MNDQELNELMQQMTTQEKIAQLTQLATPFFKGASNEGDITGPMANMNVTEDLVENAGSVLGAWGADDINSIQKQHLQENRLGIPLLFMADVIHGYRTIFPVPLAMGSSWDRELVEQSAVVAANEAAAAGIHVTFAPMVDLVRDPRWGRVMESTGEDAYLNGEMAKAQVQGFQGDDLQKNTEKLAACVKHFAGYGAAEGGRDYNTVDMSQRQLRETYLPAFKTALKAGAEMVMTGFNTVDGIPATGNKALMRDLLRKEWGFNSTLISDWGAVKELIPHGVATDEKQAAQLALEAGVDIEMMTTTYADYIQELIEQGFIDLALVDEAVMRILELKQKLGLFDNPYRGADAKQEAKILGCVAHREVSRELAAKSSVLLKNESVLPLEKGQNIALIGPFSANHDVLGPWSFRGSKEDAITLEMGLKKVIDESRLTVAGGCGIENMNTDELNDAIAVAQTADVIVLALGEASKMSGEAGSRANIQLPKSQLELIKEMTKLNKSIVTVLFNGRPLDLHGVIDESDAVLEAWFPGSEAGHAVVDLLIGDVNPSGKLSMSFPYSVGQVPVYYNHFNTGRPQDAPDAQIRYVSQYLDIPNQPLFPFGYGLSYTTYEYSNLQLSADIMHPSDTIAASLTVENTGEVAGDEIVQLYIQDVVGEVVRPLKELKDFQKIHLNPGETKEIVFFITEEQLRYHHYDLSCRSDAGKFMVYAGANSQDVLTASFQLLS